MLEELAAIPLSGPLILAIGVFDGVHRGHRHLLSRVKALAVEHRSSPGVLTFCNHPRELLNPGTSVSLIIPMEERLQLLRHSGIDYVVAVTFTREMSLLPPRQFLLELRRRLELRGLVVGPNFALGHQRQGTPPVLRALGEKMGFFVEVVPLLEEDGIMVTSTAIRNALAQGDIATVNRLLGRPFRLTAPVVRGEGRGKSLGFPTANLGVDHQQALPGDGIYATWLKVDGRWWKSATSIGVRPTFGEGKRAAEAYIMDFHGNLYQRVVSVEFAHRLRDELAFPTAEALVRQMQEDVEKARALLATPPAS